MNIARVEYYFAEMLSILEMPNAAEWELDIVPNVWSTDPIKLDHGKIVIPQNIWYIGTANNDDSTYAISDKVYDRAQPINLDTTIALSRKITVESVKHLAQHTDLIQSVDLKTGKITPSKILNVHKEESLMTYENKFVNTLIDRLYIFINTRYEKLAQVSKDEQAYTLGYETSVEDGSGGHIKLELKIESISSLDSYDASGYTVWQRVEKLKTVIEGYKGSELCTTLEILISARLS